jgi:hypothetical protein
LGVGVLVGAINVSISIGNHIYNLCTGQKNKLMTKAR